MQYQDCEILLMKGMARFVLYNTYSEQQFSSAFNFEDIMWQCVLNTAILNMGCDVIPQSYNLIKIQFN